MKLIDNLKVKEKLYIEKLENGLTVMFIPKKGTQKKYMIWGTKYGSNESKFIVPGEENITEVPDGVAHFLEHKLFEQKDGTNSLDTLSALGVEANAYTTNDHTAYLFECSENFYEAMDELMDYVQNPYFTDENVQKEQGIIGQEIMMYDDYPEWRVYLNALKAIYHNLPVRLDITGTIETISKIDKEVLYKCYNTFYNFSNMALVVCGDFEPEEIIEEVKKRLIDRKPSSEIKRIYPSEPEDVNKERIEAKLDVSQPLYVIGIKDQREPSKESENEIIKKHISVEILLMLIFGKSSDLYKKLYDNGTIYTAPSLEYEFTKNYAHILITGQANNPDEVYEKFKIEIKKIKNEGINILDFERIKKMVYGKYVREYSDVQDVSRMFLADYFKGINSFDYLEEIKGINVEYLEQILKNVFKEDKMIISIVKND